MLHNYKSQLGGGTKPDKERGGEDTTENTMVEGKERKRERERARTQRHLEPTPDWTNKIIKKGRDRREKENRRRTTTLERVRWQYTHTLYLYTIDSNGGKVI